MQAFFVLACRETQIVDKGDFDARPESLEHFYLSSSRRAEDSPNLLSRNLNLTSHETRCGTGRPLSYLAIHRCVVAL